MPSPLILPKRQPVVIQVVQDHTAFDIAMKPFRDKHDQLKGAPGEPLSKGLPENNGSGSRVRYQNGTIYQRADGSCAWVYGLIGERYDQLGAGVSWLGLPVSDEEEFSEGGRASRFENGAIYFWPDTGAIDMNQAVVHYTGLYAFAETDSDMGTTSDEPYVILGVNAPSRSLPPVQSQIYDDVDAGDSRPDLIELYRGMPEGIAISVLLMEHDEGDPDRYKAAVTAGVAAGAAGLAATIGLTPFVGAFLAPIAAGVLAKIAPDVISAIDDLIGAGDDVLGTTVLHLTAKQMVVLAARTVNQDQWGIGWKAATESLTGQGSEYKVYFGLVAV